MGGDGLAAHRVDRSAGQAALELAHEEHGVGELAGSLLGRDAGRLPDAEVGGDGVEAARVDDAGAGALRDLVEGLGAVADEEHLAREVGVVGAGHGAGLDQLATVDGIGADGGHQDSGTGGEVGAGGRVGDIDDDAGPLRRNTAQLSRQGVELVTGTPGDGDPQPLGGVVAQVSGGESPDEAGGSDEDDVEVASGRVSH